MIALSGGIRAAAVVTRTVSSRMRPLVRRAVSTRGRRARAGLRGVVAGDDGRADEVPDAVAKLEVRRVGGGDEVAAVDDHVARPHHWSVCFMYTRLAMMMNGFSVSVVTLAPAGTKLMTGRMVAVSSWVSRIPGAAR